MTHKEQQLSCRDGNSLFMQSWKPEETPLGVIALVHGLGEHSNRYGYLVDYFLARQFAVYAYDLRGHGKSSGRAGHIDRWSDHSDDLENFLAAVFEENTHAPIFLYGHSMGGQISLDYLTQRGNSKLKAAVISAPAIAEPKISAALMFIGRIFSVLLPGMHFDNGLNVNDISRDPEIVRAYREDAMVSAKISARSATEMLACIERVQANVNQIKTPLFLIHGEKDGIMSYEGTKRFHDNLKSVEKCLKIYSGGFHEPHNDVDRQQVFADVENWFNNYIAERGES